MSHMDPCRRALQGRPPDEVRSGLPRETARRPHQRQVARHRAGMAFFPSARCLKGHGSSSNTPRAAGPRILRQGYRSECRLSCTGTCVEGLHLPGCRQVTYPLGEDLKRRPRRERPTGTNVCSTPSTRTWGTRLAAPSGRYGDRSGPPWRGSGRRRRGNRQGARSGLIRRMRDSNPRGLAPNMLSKSAAVGEAGSSRGLARPSNQCCRECGSSARPCERRRHGRLGPGRQGRPGRCTADDQRRDSGRDRRRIDHAAAVHRASR